METHAAQDIQLVLMHAGEYPLASGGVCNFVVGMKDCLNEKGKMDSTGDGGWDGSERRAWCNADFKNSIPQSLIGIFKKMVTVSGGTDGKSKVTSNDYFALPAEKEIFGINTRADAIVEEELFQLAYYETTQIKKVNNAADWYWQRSTSSIVSPYFCGVTATGASSDSYPYNPGGISPFGCI